MSELKTGDLITVVYEGRDFESIVIDPDGLGPGLPSIGFGLSQASRHVGIPQQTLTNQGCFMLASEKRTVVD